jgi:hypothetical protein
MNRSKYISKTEKLRLETLRQHNIIVAEINKFRDSDPEYVQELEWAKEILLKDFVKMSCLDRV